MHLYPHERKDGLAPTGAWPGVVALGAGRIECGNPSCSRGWLSFLKDRRRPVFEGRWGCTASCVATMVDLAIQREGDEADAIEPEHRHRIPLGLIMLAQGWITNSQLQHALDGQRRAGTGLIGSWLIEECGLREDHITRAMGMQWGCPVLPLEGFDPKAMALTVPKMLVEHVGMVPLRIAGKRILYLGFDNHLDASAAFAMKRMSGLKVESGLVDATQLRQARQLLCECDFVDAAFEQLPDITTVSKRMASALCKMQPRASQMVRVHHFYWLRMWLETDSMRNLGGGVLVTKEDIVDHIYTVANQK